MNDSNTICVACELVSKSHHLTGSPTTAVAACLPLNVGSNQPIHIIYARVEIVVEERRFCVHWVYTGPQLLLNEGDWQRLFAMMTILSNTNPILFLLPPFFRFQTLAGQQPSPLSHKYHSLSLSRSAWLSWSNLPTRQASS